ncbi:hypothetical protein [Amycolatopsis sp. YIM 10]|uniref:hypothetical protein n=1 Tax=Amycolatopsis sp. YIM 10 TaxID=2653857 RepID=UPI00128FE6F2|nr:hypothetical protein [Amycolatopsis sp. YIM 10]QFU90768.1 hypothetical protein YIM_27970 [Amycolatopsis sp. YIM 10]
MTTAAWVCDSCETNNLPGAEVCRACRQPPGSATGEVRTVPAAVAPRRQQTRHVTSPLAASPRDRATLALTPPAPARPAPPPPPAGPAGTGVPRRPRRIPVAAAVATGIGGLLIWFVILGALGQSTDPAPPAPAQQAETACPPAVATWLPADGSDAVLVAAYTTDEHQIVVCRTAGGQHYYDGRKKGKPVNSETHISLEASQTANGFVAYNKSYRYEISGSELRLTRNNEVLLRETLQRTGP